MTKEEIKAIIAQKIEGQGTNLDAASVLPTILNWIIDSAEGGLPKDSFIDVGEFEPYKITEISVELYEKLLRECVLVKSGDSLYPRTSDYLVDLRSFSADLAGYIPQEYSAVIKGCFGVVDWELAGAGFTGADVIFLFSYEFEGDEHYGLIRDSV